MKSTFINKVLVLLFITYGVNVITASTIGVILGQVFASSSDGVSDISSNSIYHASSEESECDNNFVSPNYFKASAGDLLEFRRDIYNHWAIYVGDGYVINFVNMGTGKGVVKRQRLVEVAGSSLVRVNNLEAEAIERWLKPRSYNDVLKYAFSKLHTEIEYDLLEYNCEHFVTECYYGNGFSAQTDNVIGGTFASFLSSAFILSS